ncbi:MAG: hypothetical protein GY929_14780 [Actinomycetia bacterium]|nr:hypothetical protein [Actinomycetes bacterium]
MPSVLAYHRPESLDEASTLLARPDRRAVGGGTVIVPQARQIADIGVELVDLQSLGLDTIETDDNRLRLGAMVRLSDLVSHPATPTLLADLARRELPSAQRNQATVGGTAALGWPDSVLVAGLLAHNAIVEIHGAEPTALAGVLGAVTGRIITGVTIETDGAGGYAATGRTPGDEPIVAAVARATAGSPYLALTGVATTPVLVDPADPTARLSPAGDFRGSPEYRLHLAGVLAQRALGEIA